VSGGQAPLPPSLAPPPATSAPIMTTVYTKLNNNCQFTNKIYHQHSLSITTCFSKLGHLKVNVGRFHPFTGHEGP
jgi:hypothetical protein